MAIATPVRAQVVDGPITEISLSADVRHDSNVAASGRDAAVRRGIEPADERLSLGGRLILARPLGRNSMQLDAYIGYDFYRRNTRLNRERISLSGQFNVNAGPCLFTFLPRVDRRQSDLSQIAIVDLPDLDSVRNAETTQVYRGELRCGRPSGIRPLVTYQRSWGDNSREIRQRQDYRGERFGAGFSYTNPILGEFSVVAERERVNYPRRIAGGASGLEGFRLDELRLTASRDIGAVLIADGSIAYSSLKPKNSNVGDFNGVTWSLGLTANPSPPLQLRASYSRAVEPSLGSDALYQRSEKMDARATYALSSRTSISAFVSRAKRDYSGASAVLGPLLTKDRLDQVGGRFDFKPSRRLQLGLSAGYQRRTANGVVYDYNNTYVGIDTRFALGT